MSRCEPADLLFFSDREDRRITHVGIALGDGAHGAPRARPRRATRWSDSMRRDDAYVDGARLTRFRRRAAGALSSAAQLTMPLAGSTGAPMRTCSRTLACTWSSSAICIV